MSALPPVSALPCLAPPDSAAEPEMLGVKWDERHLQCIWADSRLRPALFTTGGAAVEVLDPGRWNGGPGPDFRDAAVSVAGEVRRGDVEIHVRPGDWFAHGHEADPAYASVTLHVSWFPPGDGETLPEIPLVSLRDSMLATPGFSFDQIDPTAYPWRADSAPGRPCRRAFASLRPSEIAEFLENAGRRR
ncbi:MAG: DUF2851 family protein, partial [Kiritimatiellae bacterium]|nr:DUF2851 family protein [Kiritimatiellia bacterium]